MIAAADLWYADNATETAWVVSTFFNTSATEIYPVNAVLSRYGNSAFSWANQQPYSGNIYTAWGAGQPLNTCSDMACAASTFEPNSATPLRLQAYYCQSFYNASATNMVAICKKPLCSTSSIAYFN